MVFIKHQQDLQASHNCWAWRYGAEYRFSDDAEPAGTAGKPILLAIDGQACDRVVVLVTRWFGGTKLGTGGLMRAYGGAAAKCLHQAEKIPLVHNVAVNCSCQYSDIDLLQARLGALGVQFEHAEYQTSGVLWRLQVPAAKLTEVQELYTNLSKGQGVFKPVDG